MIIVHLKSSYEVTLISDAIKLFIYSVFNCKSKQGVLFACLISLWPKIYWRQVGESNQNTRLLSRQNDIPMPPEGKEEKQVFSRSWPGLGPGPSMSGTCYRVT